MAENHGPKKPGNSPRPAPEVVETESPKSEQRRVCSWTVQNEMGDILDRMIVGAAGRILDSRQIRVIKELTESCVLCDENERTASIETETTCVSKNVETVSLQFDKRVDTKGKRETTRNCRG